MVEENPQRPLIRINDPSVSLFLGLYLILLAFFILLTTISSFSATKSVAAVGSVNSQFTSDRRVEALTGGDIMRLSGAGQLDRTLLGALRENFSAAFPSEEDTETVIGGSVQFVLPADKVFHPDSTFIQDAAAVLLVKLAASLTVSSPGLRNEIDVILRTGDEFSPATSQEQQRLVKQSGALARAMVDVGIKPRALRLGLRAGEAGTIAFLFSQIGELAPVLTFEGQPIFRSGPPQ